MSDEERIADMRRLLAALLALHGLEWDGSVLRTASPVPVPLVVDHRGNVHAIVADA